MRLTIRSLFEAVLDMGSVRVLFVRSQPVAVVQMCDTSEKWEAYQTSVANKETAEMIRCWVDDYISTASDLRVLDMESLMAYIKKCD
jgi:hypothetical protein